MVEQGASVTASCAHFGVSRRTYYRWRSRYRACGRAGLVDRSSRPHRSPRRLSVDHAHEPRPSKATLGGYVVLYAALDDASRLAYTETLADERGETAAGFLQRAIGYFSACGIRSQRVLTDNGSPFVSDAWRVRCA